MTKQSSQTSGAVLTVRDVDEIAVRIAEMHNNYSTDRRSALILEEEARRFVFGTDINQTSAAELPHKNRTHQPKLTQISDTLQSHYFEASLSMPKFFVFNGDTPQDRSKAQKIEKWISTKLEQRKFREVVGRQLLADYVNYGNCFCDVDYVVEKDEFGQVTYKGPDVRRVAPMDLAINPRADSFKDSIKLQRKLMHISKVAELADKFPLSGFDANKIRVAIESRTNSHIGDWIEVLKERGLEMDGWGGFDQYFKQDLVELLIYRGDLFDPETGETQKNRIIYVVDRLHVIRNEPNKTAPGSDGLHHAGWRIRNDNIWAQGPLANLLGLQYRIDHLENLKADVFDQIAHPTIIIKGEEVDEPESGWAPGATYYVPETGSVEVLRPDATALQANTEMSLYERRMDEYAGTPQEARGQRTPGEKTAFEVSTLTQNATMLFVDKARNFERMLETLLKEIFELMLINFDGEDYINIFNDVSGEEELRALSTEDVAARGDFVAMGARHWSRRNRETMEIQNFMSGPLQDPKIRQHASGLKIAEFFERKLHWEDEGIIEEFAGVKEDVVAKGIAQAEAQRLEDAAGGPLGGEEAVSPAEALQQEQGGARQGSIAASQLT